MPCRTCFIWASTFASSSAYGWCKLQVRQRVWDEGDAWTLGDVYLCGPLRPLEFCDMISGLLREIGGVCPCTGSPKEERHLVGSRGCRRRWRGRGVRRSLQGWDLTITERDAASLKNGNDARRHCPWQGEPGCPNKSANASLDSWTTANDRIACGNGTSRLRVRGDAGRWKGSCRGKEGACAGMASLATTFTLQSPKQQTQKAVSPRPQGWQIQKQQAKGTRSRTSHFQLE